MVVAGKGWAKVKRMFNEHREPVDSAPPATPVMIVGWREMPTAGEECLQVCVCVCVCVCVRVRACVRACMHACKHACERKHVFALSQKVTVFYFYLFLFLILCVCVCVCVLCARAQACVCPKSQSYCVLLCVCVCGGEGACMRVSTHVCASMCLP